jgi:hypothetical protein
MPPSSRIAVAGPHRWVTLADPEGDEFCVG